MILYHIMQTEIYKLNQWGGFLGTEFRLIRIIENKKQNEAI